MSTTQIMMAMYFVVIAGVMLYFFIVIGKKESKGTVEKSIAIKTKREEIERKFEAIEVTSDLTKVKGIGPKLSEKLRKAGIRNVNKLAASTPSEVAKGLGVSEKRAVGFIESARNLLQEKT